ncbi:hypothetical protein D3C76_1491400 [compost metagenome]
MKRRILLRKSIKNYIIIGEIRLFFQHVSSVTNLYVSRGIPEVTTADLLNPGIDLRHFHPFILESRRYCSDAKADDISFTVVREIGIHKMKNGPGIFEYDALRIV